MTLVTEVYKEIRLDKCLKSRVSEDPLTENKAIGPKHYWYLNSRAFILFFNHCEVSFSDTQNPKGVC